MNMSGLGKMEITCCLRLFPSKVSGRPSGMAGVYIAVYILIGYGRAMKEDGEHGEVVCCAGGLCTKYLT